MSQPISVLLTTEGTYPFYEGGVSTWCDVLIRKLPDVRFTLFSLAARPGLAPAYALPANVDQWLPVPLWGTGGVTEIRREIGWRALREMRHNFDQPSARAAFAEAFEMLLEGLLGEPSDLRQLGYGLRRLAHFFNTHDYDAVFRQPITWDLFQKHVHRWRPALRAQFAEPQAPTLFDVGEALRLLYRWLTPLAVPVPPADLIHATAAGLASLPAIVARLERRTPFVLTEHGVYLRERYLAWAHADFSSFVGAFASQVMRRLVELSYARADVIVPVTTWNARWEQRLGAAPERIEPIPNGVDPRHFTPRPMPDPTPPTLVWVGRVDPLKDLLTLIDATARIRQAIPDARVLLYGSTPPGNEAYAATCRARQRELGLETALQWMGFTSAPQDAYAQGHIVLLSSISEGLPFAIIEAMLCGRPVVATAVGGVPETIGDTGRVVPPRDGAALAAACIALLRDPRLCEELGRRARERALAHYSLPRMVAAYRAMYQRLITCGRPIPATFNHPVTPGWLTAGSGFGAPKRARYQRGPV